MLLNIAARSAFPPVLQSPINAGAFCMLAGLVIVPVVSLVTPAPEHRYVESIFSCYEQQVVVTVRKSIGEAVVPAGKMSKKAIDSHG